MQVWPARPVQPRPHLGRDRRPRPLSAAPPLARRPHLHRHRASRLPAQARRSDTRPRARCVPLARALDICRREHFHASWATPRVGSVAPPCPRRGRAQVPQLLLAHGRPRVPDRPRRRQADPRPPQSALRHSAPRSHARTGLAARHVLRGRALRGLALRRPLNRPLARHASRVMPAHPPDPPAAPNPPTVPSRRRPPRRGGTTTVPHRPPPPNGTSPPALFRGRVTRPKTATADLLTPRQLRTDTHLGGGKPP